MPWCTVRGMAAVCPRVGGHAVLPMHAKAIRDP